MRVGVVDVLRVLKSGGGMSVPEITSVLKVKPGSISGLIANMSRYGSIDSVIQTTPRGRKYNGWYITEKGREQLARKDS